MIFFPQKSLHVCLLRPSRVSERAETRDNGATGMDKICYEGPGTLEGPDRADNTKRVHQESRAGAGIEKLTE